MTCIPIRARSARQPAPALDWLQREFAAFGLPAEGRIVVVDGTDHIAMCHPDPEGLVPHPTGLGKRGD